MTDEQALLAALRAQDPDAFAAVFNAHADRLFRLAFGLLGNDYEAECVVQDSFLRLIESLDSFEGRSALATWLYRVAYNLSVDRLRRRRPNQLFSEEPDDDEATPMPAIFVDWSQAPETLLASDEARAELEKAIAELPESLRSVFILREIEGLSTGEAAEVLGIGEGALKVRLHRARLLLRERLSSYFSERLSVGE